MKTKQLILLLLILLISRGNAQISDTIANKTVSEKIKLKEYIAPTVLITGGFLLLNTTTNQDLQKDIRSKFGNDFRTSIDDYTQFAPIAQILAGSYMGFKAKNDFVHQSINVAVANAIMLAVVSGMKYSFREERPDKSNKMSFPSGHTAAAFTNASLLFYEYKDANLWYASSGFLFATATGILRIANNKHYAYDVLTGAGIGMGVGLLVSYWNPFKSFQLNSKSKKTTSFVYPQIGNQIGLGLVVQYK